MVSLPPELLSAPELPLILQAISFRLENEKLARDEYRKWLPSDLSAEFINGDIVKHSPCTFLENTVASNLMTVLDAFARQRVISDK
jgi:hypothetical protein